MGILPENSNLYIVFPEFDKQAYERVSRLIIIAPSFIGAYYSTVHGKKKWTEQSSHDSNTMSSVG